MATLSNINLKIVRLETVAIHLIVERSVTNLLLALDKFNCTEKIIATWDLF